jgi:hypothetical protein
MVNNDEEEMEAEVKGVEDDRLRMEVCESLADRLMEEGFEKKIN